MDQSRIASYRPLFLTHTYSLAETDEGSDIVCIKAVLQVPVLY